MNVVAVDRHRRIAVCVCFLRTILCTYVHLDGLIPARNENAPRPGCVHEGAAATTAAALPASRNLLNGHIALRYMQSDTI